MIIGPGAGQVDDAGGNRTPDRDGPQPLDEGSERHRLAERTPLRSPTRGERPLRQFARDERAGAAAAVHIALGGELVIGHRHGGTGDVQGDGKLAGGRQPIARGEAAVENAAPPFVIDLPVERQLTPTIDGDGAPQVDWSNVAEVAASVEPLAGYAPGYGQP